MRTAIIHDWLIAMGGAERVILAFKEIFPDAPVYTTVYNADNVDPLFHSMDIRTSFLQRLPGAKHNHQKLLPLMPTAVEQFDLSEYDVVLSSSSSVAKGVLTKAETLHICYCHTPMRYAWDFYQEYLKGPDVGVLKGKAIPWLMNYIRMWDRLSADRVDYFVANSQNVARRINKHYHRDSVVIHPPVDASFFQPKGEVEDHFLVVSRLVPYKKVDLAIEACNRLQLPLIVIGTGSEYDRLKKLAGPTVKMLGRVNDEETRKYYARCKAFLFPGEEDFGITPLEAQASGRPVIAFGKGGVLETVLPGVTGEFFYAQTADALVECLRSFEPGKYDTGKIRLHAESFDKERFKEKIRSFVTAKYQQFKGSV